MDATTHKPAAPCRLITAFLEQKARLLAALRDEGGLFELRFLLGLVKREQTAVTLASVEADTISAETSTLRQKVIGYLNDSKTPGEIDAAEADALMKDLRKIGTHATHHAEHLGHLV